ncbi:hypothetical protein QFZ79_003037 [Arthrobacter sp. V4I6]|uniref:hypothetical protein n=1 Tax=unclassified Arthrobacter TaxID=235627 RepID=UPI002788CBC4|nr:MULTISPECIES: hypothetical protein [unclassified Arthrobacter]MDQ0820667.1 hypothetical protein [Arthrobacter sp. V1I7]MDQ0854926.1 hypothetical protein [Arthrobacter sp. V4I6]
MSQEQPPVRSRRELRQARDERLEAGQESGTGAPGAVGPASNPASPKTVAAKPASQVDTGEPTAAEITGRTRRVADGPVDSVRTPAGSERSSQVRARDRAALRTIKELAEKEGHLAGGGPPTRRQLRLLQLAAETAPATAANLIVPASPRTRATPVVGQPGTKPGTKSGDVPAPGKAPAASDAPAAKEAAAGKAPAAKEAAGGKAAGKTPVPGDAPAPGKAPAAKEAATGKAAGKAGGEKAAGKAAPAPAPASGPKRTDPGADTGAPGPGGQLPDGMTVEQALAARELLARQAHNQLSKMEHIAANDPDAVDPDVLAEQIAMAERAAVLNRRAAAKQKLAAQNGQPAPLRNDPSTASNLAMVTPLEFEQVPGVERPVMKRPATSYVPVVTNPGPRVEDPRKSGGRRPGSSRQRSVPATGRAGVLARAEAAAKGAAEGAAEPATRAKPAVRPAVVPKPEEEFAGRAPVAANSAYGLDPLDAATAGLGRARRLRMLQLGVLALGILALIAGITLIITGLAG